MSTERITLFFLRIPDSPVWLAHFQLWNLFSLKNIINMVRLINYLLQVFPYKFHLIQLLCKILSIYCRILNVCYCESPYIQCTVCREQTNQRSWDMSQLQLDLPGGKNTPGQVGAGGKVRKCVRQSIQPNNVDIMTQKEWDCYKCGCESTVFIKNLTFLVVKC